MGGEQQFVVVTAAQQRMHRPVRFGSCGGQGGERQQVGVHRAADPGALEDVPQVAEQTVRDIEHGAGEAAQGEAERYPWLGPVERRSERGGLPGREFEFAAKSRQGQRSASRLTRNP